MTSFEIIQFIEESNKIEDVHSLSAIEDSIDAWIYLQNVKQLTMRDILNVHYLIMKNLNHRIAGKTRGELLSNVQVGGRMCPSHHNVLDLLIFLLTATNSLTFTENSIKSLHIRFENIHPFEDGNGRIGRLLYLWMREQAHLPFKLIKFEKRREYYDWFE